MNGAELGCGRPPSAVFSRGVLLCINSMVKGKLPFRPYWKQLCPSLPKKARAHKGFCRAGPLRHRPSDCKDLCVVHARDPHPDARAVRLDDLVVAQINRHMAGRQDQIARLPARKRYVHEA